MIPKGFLMALKQVLPALGIKIDHERVEQVFEQAATAIPQLIKYTHEKLDKMESSMDDTNGRLAAIEFHMKKLEESNVSTDLERMDANGRGDTAHTGNCR